VIFHIGINQTKSDSSSLTSSPTNYNLVKYNKVMQLSVETLSKRIYKD